jgi:hypothetical protein
MLLIFQNQVQQKLTKARLAMRDAAHKKQTNNAMFLTASVYAS